MNDADLKQLWKTQPLTASAFSLDQLKGEATRMQRRIKMRNGLEYAACVLVTCVFAFYIHAFQHPLMRAGSVLVILGTLLVAWQMGRRASAKALPCAEPGQSWLEYQRTQLSRQRDALRSVWLWYVAPLVPGLVVFRWGVETELAPDGPFARGWVPNVVMGAVFLGVAALNRHAARRLQHRIDSLDQQVR